MSNRGYVTLHEVLNEYAQHLSRRDISDNTRKAFLGDVRIFARHMGEDKKIYEVTSDRIRDFLDNNKNATSPKSEERRLTSLKVFFDWVQLANYLAVNPAENIAYKPLLDPLPSYLTEAQMLAVINAAKQVAVGEKLESRPLTAIMLVLETGIKKGECLNLTLADIDRTKTDTPAIWVRYKPKHLKFKDRVLGISKDCLTHIDEMVDHFECKDKLFECTGRNLEYLFNRQVAKLAGLPSLTFEMLRWTSALNDYRSGDFNEDQMRHKYGLSPVGWMEMQAKLERISN
jgi:integrase/recombinase XerD